MYNYIIREVLGRNMCVATCAYTDLQPLYYTMVKPLFKLPVPVLNNSTCNIKPNSRHAEHLRQQQIIVFDE